MKKQLILRQTDRDGDIYTSSDGKVYRVTELSQHTMPSGYVRISKIKGIDSIYVHRLVAQDWVPNPEQLPVINHIDEDKSNNHADNLKWCTQKENCNHGDRNNKIKVSLVNRKNINFILCVETGQVFVGLKAAATYIKDQNKVSSKIDTIIRNLRNVAIKKNQSYYGCNWKLISKEEYLNIIHKKNTMFTFNGSNVHINV